jgi:hypothetical protein
MSAILSPQARAVMRLWQRLPREPVNERRLDAAILQVTASYEHDYAKAAALRASLLSSGAITMLRHGNRPEERMYQRVAELPEWPVDNGPGSAAFNADLARRHALHEEELRRQDAERAAEAQRAINPIYAHLLAEVDRRIADAEARILAQLTTLLTNTPHDAGQGQPHDAGDDQPTPEGIINHG